MDITHVKHVLCSDIELMQQQDVLFAELKPMASSIPQPNEPQRHKQYNLALVGKKLWIEDLWCVEY